MPTFPRYNSPASTARRTARRAAVGSAVSRVASRIGGASRTPEQRAASVAKLRETVRSLRPTPRPGGGPSTQPIRSPNSLPDFARAPQPVIPGPSTQPMRVMNNRRGQPNPVTAAELASSKAEYAATQAKGTPPKMTPPKPRPANNISSIGSAVVGKPKRKIQTVVNRTNSG